MRSTNHQRQVNNSSDVLPSIRSTKENLYIPNKVAPLIYNGVHDFSSISILPKGANSLQPKLKINPSNDKYEQEADRVAEQVVKSSNQNLQAKHSTRRSKTAIQRKCDKCEDEEVIQTKPKGSSEGIASSGLISQIQNTKGGGRSMDTNTRSFMESRIGVDFGGVRIHTDNKAIGMNQEINAKAFTVGQNVYFNRGTYNPSSTAGKKLIAHELTHTIQQGGSDLQSYEPSNMIQRAPKEELAEEGTEKEICVLIYVGTDLGGGSSLGTCESLTENTEVDVFQPTVFEGDVFQLEVQELDNPPSNWVLPADLELVQNVDDSTVMLRVVGSINPSEEDRKTKVIIETEEGVPNVTVLISLNGLGSTADTLNPEMLENETDRTKLKKERKSKRQTFKSEKKALKQEFRSLDKDEKREKRQTFKSEKSKLRSARKEERKDLRSRRQNLRKEKRALDSASSCSLKYQRIINTALNKAVTITSSGVSKLQKGTSDSKVTANLTSIMKWPSGSKDESENAAIIQKISDVLKVAKNNMLLSKDSTFNCGSVRCSEDTGAFVNSGSGRGGDVTVCTNWLLNKVKFGFAGTPSDHQAFALLHEFVHLAGPQGANETYVHKESEWKKLSHERAMEMADGYARIAWNLGR